MKISFFDDEPELFPLQYGGKARTIINLATELSKNPEVEKVTILSRSIVSEKKEFFLNGVNFVALDDNNTISRIVSEMNEADILNIHCCSFTFPIISGKAKKFYFLHDVLIATADRGSCLDKSLGGYFDAVIAPSEFAKSIYNENKKLIGGDTNCYVIPRHINTDMFYHISKDDIKIDEKAPQIVKDIINKYKYIFFFPSRPIEEKGGKYLIEISKKLEEDFEDYCIIGPFGNNKDLPKSCIDTGWIESNDLKYYYSISDVTFNFSYLPESFSQVCIESAYCKTPVVAFKSGNIPSLGNLINTIFLVEKSTESIMDGISSALNIKKNSKNMKETQKIIIDNFGKEKIINEYLNLYKKYMEK